jgi:hypothetical protein
MKSTNPQKTLKMLKFPEQNRRNYGKLCCFLFDKLRCKLRAFEQLRTYNSVINPVVKVAIGIARLKIEEE